MSSSWMDMCGSIRNRNLLLSFSLLVLLILFVILLILCGFLGSPTVLSSSLRQGPSASKEASCSQLLGGMNNVLFDSVSCVRNNILNVT